MDRFKIIYGKEYFTSNLHNLSHLSGDVKRFGPLNLFNTYPFESKLYKIGRLLRSGNLPLAQIAKRLIEEDYQTILNLKKKRLNPEPILKRLVGTTVNNLNLLISTKYDLYSYIELSQMKLDCNRDDDRWILT